MNLSAWLREYMLTHTEAQSEERRNMLLCIATLQSCEAFSEKVQRRTQFQLHDSAPTTLNRHGDTVRLLDGVTLHYGKGQ